jgi:hypothetical protein
VGAGCTFNQHRFERAAEDAWNLGLIDPPRQPTTSKLHRCRGKDGVARLETWLDGARPGAGDPEQSRTPLIEALEQIGLPHRSASIR